MTSRFRVSGLLSRKLEELGLSPVMVLRYAGLPITLFDQKPIFVSTDELFALWTAIGEVGRDPAIGLKIGSEHRVERYSPPAIAALYSRSFRDALHRMARYKQLTCPEELQVVCADNQCTVRFHWILAKQPEPLWLVDCCFAWVATIGRRGTGGPLNPLRVDLRREPANRELLEEFFGCRVNFRQEQNAIVYREHDLSRPFLTHNADLLELLAPQLEAELDQQRAPLPFKEYVKQTLKRVLAGQRPSIQGVARELNLSVRTLQRRLTESGASFKELLEEARRELAHHYLLQSSVELNEAAYLLGYESANSFFRAFHSWEGTSPGRWRDGKRQVNGEALSVH
ncbi:MAG: AraC family transcriptional regulator ligand-binding domain-containing protein [Verrucomicrobia bacterium]|nr:AraC family transcriptional regulator ligand-binding domain-containing protein [Verrucomicrobiota bacterium]